jgi:tetratricopeptide (TPR) repeat protein
LAAVGLAAAAVVAAVVLAVGGGDDGSPAAKRDDGAKAQAPAEAKKAPKQTKKDDAPAQSTPAGQPAADQPDPAQQTPAQPTGVDPARGVALNNQGFELMRQGDYAAAAPILLRAVASWPKDSTDLDYAYALYNLGTSLNRSGNPSAAIPYLFKRMQWPNQRGVVKKELQDAQRRAGEG